MEIKSYAKINLTLNITGVDPVDNYHLLEMVNIPLDFHDTLEIEVIDGQESYITSNSTSIPLDCTNLVIKAIQLIKKTYSLKENFHVHINKRIPMEAGLAGGSSNAAATLIGINQILKLGIAKEELASLGMKLGSDVAYCVFSVPCLVEGKGEKITPFSIKANYYVLLIKPQYGLSTKEVYTLYDKYASLHEVKHSSIEEIKLALEKDDEELLKRNLINNLEIPAFSISPSLKELKESIINEGLDKVVMTGSGSTIFALSKDKKKLMDIAAKNNKNGNFVLVTEFKK
ncbi:MAG: 4-(cytidine 5'-diphospho)-2-C-methyl-D-erythritol kinase [Bacilli bacterium]